MQLLQLHLNETNRERKFEMRAGVKGNNDYRICLQLFGQKII